MKEKFYADDPLFKYAIRTGHAFWWWNIEQFHKLTPPQEKFISAMKQFEVGDGYAIPTYGPNGRNGFFGLGLGKFAKEGPALEAHLLQTLCQAVHLKYCSITRSERKKTMLSSKEKEVMTHVVRGESTNDIARELGVSTNTVNTHLKRIYAKMDVSDRVSATLRFLAFGYIYE